MDITSLLVKGKRIKSSNLKELLFKYRIKENKCEICGTSEWQGLPITCQLHHVDGDNTNNCIENLQILCPNCHSQTDTYCSSWKNQHNKNHCLLCGKEITKNSVYCLQCYHKKERKVERPTIEQLFNDFKQLHSYTKVGKKYGVSGNAVKKWCKYYDITPI